MDDLGGIKLIQASELNSEIVRGAVDYWQSKRSGDAPPFTDSLDPLEVPRLLPHLMLKDVRRDPWDFRYRVVGTTVREHSRHNWTGKWMSEVDGQGEGSTVFRVMRWVSEGGAARDLPPALCRPAQGVQILRSRGHALVQPRGAGRPRAGRGGFPDGLAATSSTVVLGGPTRLPRARMPPWATLAASSSLRCRS